MTTGTPTALHLERTFAATPERVFDAWTNPAVLRRWWAAQPQQETTVADVDLRVGGRYRLTMSGPEGDFTVSGRFEEIEQPDRLVYTWAWEGMPPMDTLVTVEFRAEGDGTRVILTHAGLPGDDSRGQHEHGWHAVLDSLERALVSAA